MRELGLEHKEAKLRERQRRNESCEEKRHGSKERKLERFKLALLIFEVMGESLLTYGLYEYMGSEGFIVLFYFLLYCSSWSFGELMLNLCPSLLLWFWFCWLFLEGIVLWKFYKLDSCWVVWIFWFDSYFLIFWFCESLVENHAFMVESIWRCCIWRWCGQNQ